MTTEQIEYRVHADIADISSVKKWVKEIVATVSRLDGLGLTSHSEYKLHYWNISPAELHEVLTTGEVIEKHIIHGQVRYLVTGDVQPETGTYISVVVGVTEGFIVTAWRNYPNDYDKAGYKTYLFGKTGIQASSSRHGGVRLNHKKRRK